MKAFLAQCSHNEILSSNGQCVVWGACALLVLVICRGKRSGNVNTISPVVRHCVPLYSFTNNRLRYFLFNLNVHSRPCSCCGFEYNIDGPSCEVCGVAFVDMVDPDGNTLKREATLPRVELPVVPAFAALPKVPTLRHDHYLREFLRANGSTCHAHAMAALAIVGGSSTTSSFVSDEATAKHGDSVWRLLEAAFPGKAYKFAEVRSCVS